MHRDADAIPGPEAAGIPLAPVGARGAVVQKMSVDVDEHPALSLLLLLRISGQAPETCFLLVVDPQVQIGRLGCFILENSILIINVVETIDGRFAR
jgi:hypothetical protein